MARVPDLVGRIRMDTRDLDRAKGSVASFSRSTGSVFGDLDKGLTSVSKSMQQAGEGLSEFGKRASVGVSLPVVAGLSLATKAASDLSEQINKTTVVFGDAADGVISFSEDAAKGLGQSQRAALEAAGTYGNLFAAIGLTTGKSAEMSKVLLTLGADLASFNNANPEDVFLALRSGLTGESEPLKKFGVNLNETTLKAKALELGLSDGVSVLDASAKAQAAYALILEQTATAQGDFARTSGGLANQTRILRAELEDAGAEMGEHLIPIALKLTSAASGILDAFDSMPAAAQNLSLIGLAAIASVGPLSYLAGSVAKVRAATATATAAIGAQSFGAGVAAASATRLAGGLVKVAGTAGALYAVVQGLQAIGGSANDAAVNMRKLGEASGEELVASFNLARSFGGDIADKAFAVILDASVSEAQRLVDALAATGQETGKYQEAIDGAAAAEGRAIVTKEKDVAVTEKAAAAMRGSTVATGENAAATASLVLANENLFGTSSSLADIVNKVNDATDKRRTAVLGVVDAEAANRRATTSFADAISDVADKERDLAAARRGRTASTRDAITVERALNSVEDAQSSIVDQERALADARAGRGSRAKELASAEKELRKAREEAAGAHGVKAAAEGAERVAEAEERVREARADGGQQEDVRAATEALSRAQLDARDAALALAESREQEANREKAAEEALFTSRQNATAAAVASARAAQDLAEQQAKAAGETLTVSESYNVYRNRLIELKDQLTPGSALRTALEETINAVGEIPDSKRITVTADTEAATNALNLLSRLVDTIKADTAAFVADPFGGRSPVLTSAKLGTIPSLVPAGAGASPLPAGTLTGTTRTVQNNTISISGVREAEVVARVNEEAARLAGRAR